MPISTSQTKKEKIEQWVEMPCDECGLPYFLKLNNYNAKTRYNGFALMRHMECARAAMKRQPLINRSFGRKNYDNFN